MTGEGSDGGGTAGSGGISSGTMVWGGGAGGASAGPPGSTFAWALTHADAASARTTMAAQASRLMPLLWTNGAAVFPVLVRPTRLRLAAA